MRQVIRKKLIRLPQFDPLYFPRRAVAGPSGQSHLLVIGMPRSGKRPSLANPAGALRTHGAPCPWTPTPKGGAYPIDPGLIPVFDRSGKANLGHALETAVLLELERRGFTSAYVRTPDGFEVDFLARNAEGDEYLVQVCAELDDAGTLAREVRALEAAAALHPGAEAIVITLGPPARLPAVSTRVAVHAASAWLLTR